MLDSLGNLATIHYGQSPKEIASLDGDFPIVGTGGVYGATNQYLYERGIVVARKGSLGNPHCFFTPFWPVDTTYAVLPKGDVSLKWLFYCLQNFDLSKLNEATGVPSINRNWLAKISFYNPGKTRQKKIATILSTIDSAIEHTEALIEKYQNIRTGLMQDLFTRGLLPNGQLRPPREQAPELYQKTDIGWIPKDWGFTTCESLCLKIIDCKNRTPPVMPEGYPVIRTPNVRDGRFIEADLACTDYGSYLLWTARGKPQPGDIVITREAPVGEVCIIPETHPNTCLGQRMMLYRPDETKVCPQFFLHMLLSERLQNRLDLISGGSTVGHVRVGDIRELWAYHPKCIDEQRKIADAINSVEKKLLIEESHKEKLHRKKLGLMQDLLTGKVPVPIDEAPVEPAPTHA